MSYFATLVFAALLALPNTDLPEQQVRAAVIACAIDSATLEATCEGPWADSDTCEVIWPGSRAELAAVLIMTGDQETRFAERVQAGRCRPFECDALALPGGAIFHRARSYWQLHASPLVPLNEWSEIVGVEYFPTANAAYAASRVLGEGRKRCRSLEGALASYATGRSCRWSPAAARAALARRIASALR